MEDSQVHFETNEEASSLTILSFPGIELPEQYFNFVRSRYLRSLRDGCDFFKKMHAKCYYDTQPPFFLTLISRPGVSIRLAVLSDDPDVALGFSIVDNTGLLHYVYVGKDFRKQGIGKALAPGPYRILTHYTKAVLPLSRKFPGAVFNPYA